MVQPQIKALLQPYNRNVEENIPLFYSKALYTTHQAYYFPQKQKQLSSSTAITILV